MAIERRNVTVPLPIDEYEQLVELAHREDRPIGRMAAVLLGATMRQLAKREMRRIAAEEQAANAAPPTNPYRKEGD